MARALNIACLQTRPMPSVETALAEAVPLAEKSLDAGAQFLFLPEYCGGLVSKGTALVPPAFEEQDHPFLRAFRKLSRERRVWVLIGSIAVLGNEGKIINRGYIVNDNGGVVGRYDKIHMFDVQLSKTGIYQESVHVTPGKTISVVRTPHAQIGHTICYDLRFPHIYRDLSKAGAEILCIPAAFTKKTGKAHWHILNRARAIENGTFVVSPCAVGAIKGGGESYGHSVIINPWGEVLADGGEYPGIVMAKINLDEVVNARGKIPSLSHDRPYTLI